jgi:hypothetical protein
MYSFQESVMQILLINSRRELFMNGVNIKPLSPNSTYFIYWVATDYIAF